MTGGSDSRAYRRTSNPALDVRWTGTGEHVEGGAMVVIPCPVGEPPDLDQLQAQLSNPAQDAEQRRLVGQLATQDRTDRIDGELQPLPQRDSSRVAAVTSDPDRVSDLCHEQHPRPLG